MTFAVVILAGGRGRRMGGDKPMALLGGRPLIDHAIAQARTWANDIAVSLRDPDQFPLPEVVTPLMDSNLEGPLGGIGAALQFAQNRGLEYVLTTPCDVPFAPADLPGRLEDALVTGVGVAVARSGERVHPTCALWRSSVLDDLPDFAASGKSSLNGFAAHIGVAVADWPCVPYDPFFNINRPEDLAAAELLLKRR